MSKLTWIILGIISASCRAHFGLHRSDGQLPSQPSPFRKSADVLLRAIGISPEDHQCFTLARRPFVVSRMVQLPCNKLMSGMPVVRSYMGPFGPMCVSYIRNTVYKHYRLPLCCPGFTADPSSGRCTVRTGNLPQTPQMQQQLENLMNMASQMRQAMWIKAKQDLARKQAMILMSMHDRQQRINRGMSMIPRMISGMPLMPRMVSGMPIMPRFGPKMSVMPGIFPETHMKQRWVTDIPMLPQTLPKMSMAPPRMPRFPVEPPMIPRIPMAPHMMPRMPMVPQMMPRMPMVPQMMSRMPITPQMMSRMPMAPHIMPRMSLAPNIMPRMPMTPRIMPRMLILSRMPMIPHMMTRMPMAPKTPMMHIMSMMPHMHMLPMAMTRPPFSQMFSAYNLNRQPQPRMDFPNFGNPFKPPMSPPFQQPPLSDRFVNFMVARPPFPYIPRSNFPAVNHPVMMVTRPQPMISKLVLSDRTNLLPLSQMQEFHPQMPSFSQLTRNEQTLSELNSPEFPTIPKVQPQMNPDQPDGFQGEANFQRDAGPYQETAPSDGFNATPPPQEAHVTDNIVQETVPDKAAEMPALMVEQAPSAIAESCIARLDAAVKACLTQNNIDVPDVMSAFEPFNEDKSRVLCKAEDAIFKCITDSLNDCNNSNDADMAREMLMETAQTVKNMCDLRDLSVQESGVVQHAQSTNGADTVANAENVDALFQDSGVVQDAQNTNRANTVATAENVDALPNNVKELPAAHNNHIVTFFEKNDVPHSSAFKDAIKHEVHVQELKMKGYLLPILIGSGVGFIILVIFMSILICCCCKRKLKRKMKITKEVEKPPINDGIYTIGIPPPIYEVNGIPHMYYEEAKGEKISSKSSTILEGTMTKVGEDTQM